MRPRPLAIRQRGSCERAPRTGSCGIWRTTSPNGRSRNPYNENDGGIPFAEQEEMKPVTPEDAATGRARRLRRLVWRVAVWGGGAAGGFALLGAGLAWAFLNQVRIPGQGTPADSGLEYE